MPGAAGEAGSPDEMKQDLISNDVHYKHMMSIYIYYIYIYDVYCTYMKSY